MLAGRYVFHKRCISWSYLSLGNELLTQTNRNIIKPALINKENVNRIPCVHPPINNMANKKLIKII